MKFLKLFATWQHQAATGTYSIDSDILVLLGLHLVREAGTVCIWLLLLLFLLLLILYYHLFF